jgi:hypothetical protein
MPETVPDPARRDDNRSLPAALRRLRGATWQNLAGSDNRESNKGEHHE